MRMRFNNFTRKAVHWEYLKYKKLKQQRRYNLTLKDYAIATLISLILTAIIMITIGLWLASISH